MGLVKKKGNTKAKVGVEKFFEVKRLLLQDIKSVVTMEYQQSWCSIGIKLGSATYHSQSGLWKKKALRGSQLMVKMTS